MKKIAKWGIIMAAAGLCAVPASLWAQFQPEKFYLKADLGGNWVMDTDLKEFFGPVAPGTTVKFDPGYRVGFAAGYEFTDWFALEAELGFMGNNIDSITGARHVDAFLGNVPFLVNARFQYKNASRFTPYIGGGVGMSTLWIDVDHIQLGNTEIWGTESDAVFAYQGFAGIRFAINEVMGLSLEYRFVGADSPDFKSDYGWWYGGSWNDSFRLGSIQTHAVSLAFDVHF